MDVGTARGSKDCRICNRRRIKCDRRLPHCKKCELRNLKCTGYGLILQWDQGVASRGTLAGKAVPIRPPKKALAAYGRQPDTMGFSNRKGIQGAEIEEYPTVKSTSQAVEKFRPVPGICEIIPSLYIGREVSPISSPLLLDRNARLLLHHYDHIVAPNMAWGDCPNTPWRDIIIPMALESPPLFCSVLAFAAKHRCAVDTSEAMIELSSRTSNQSMVFQRRALELLSQELRQITTLRRTGGSSDFVEKELRSRSNAVLATMLVLCNVETVWPDSSIWRVHLDAARTVITSQGQKSPFVDACDPTSVFLGQELFIANTFASMTNFIQSADEDILAAGQGTPFIDFLKLLHMVTRLERQAFIDPQLVCNSGISLSGLKKLFEDARSRTLEANRKIIFSLPDGYLQFSRVANSFYHAGLIYSYRALFDIPVLKTRMSQLHPNLDFQISELKGELFRILNFMDMDKPTFAQDLVWPLFIAGTEACWASEQDMVVNKLQQAMRGTGFSNCQQALKFLRAFWERGRAGADHRGFHDQHTYSSAAPPPHNWINFAREWAVQGHTFIVF